MRPGRAGGACCTHAELPLWRAGPEHLDSVPPGVIIIDAQQEHAARAARGRREAARMLARVRAHRGLANLLVAPCLPASGADRQAERRPNRWPDRRLERLTITP